MAFRAPRFSHAHAFRERGIANLSLGTGAADSDFPLDNLIDDRAGLLFKLSATGALELECDAGALVGFDRIIIPAGHNIDEECLVEEDTANTFPTPTVLATFTPTTGVLIDEAITASTEQFLRLRIVNTTVAWEMSEVVLTTIVTLTAGPELENSTDEKEYNFTRLSYPSGVSPTIQHGAPQRSIQLEYPELGQQTASDLTKMEALIDDVDMNKPFWVDPASFSTPPETDEPVLWMKFARAPRSSNTILVPASGTRSKSFSLELIESLD